MSSCNEITNILLHHPTKKLKMCHIPKTLCRFTGKDYPGWKEGLIWMHRFSAWKKLID